MHRLAVVALLASVCLAASARADNEEWRFALIGTARTVSTQAGDADGQGMAFGGRTRLGYGVFDALELAAHVSYARADAIEFSGARDGSQIGTLYSDVELLSAGLELRLELGVETWRGFERVHPIASVGAAGLGRRLSGQTLLNDRNMILSAPESTLEVAFAWGGSGGVAVRLGDHLFLAIVADFLQSAVTSERGLGLEISWAWY